jgi:hypothetical protein
VHGPPDLKSMAKRQSGRTSSVLSKDSKAPGVEGEEAGVEQGEGGEARAAEREGEGGGGGEEGGAGGEAAAKAEDLAMTAEVCVCPNRSRVPLETPFKVTPVIIRMVVSPGPHVKSLRSSCTGSYSQIWGYNPV